MTPQELDDVLREHRIDPTLSIRKRKAIPLNTPKLIAMKCSEEYRCLIKKVADARGITLSSLIRLALSKEVSPNELTSAAFGQDTTPQVGEPKPWERVIDKFMARSQDHEQNS